MTKSRVENLSNTLPPLSGAIPTNREYYLSAGSARTLSNASIFADDGYHGFRIRMARAGVLPPYLVSQ